MYREKVDIFRSSYDLIYFILNETSECISKFPMSTEQIDEITFAYIRSLKRIHRLKYELDRINKSLHEIIDRYNDRINLMLSMAATTFLPLTFLTGKCICICMCIRIHVCILICVHTCMLNNI